MAKNNKKKQYKNNEGKKEATTMCLAKIAKLFLSSEDKKAMEVGRNVEKLVADVGDLPPEVFEQFGAKLEKKMNELAPQNTGEILTRLEQLATQLEKAQAQQAAPVAAGLAGVHNTYKLDELNGEVANLKASTDELQALQRQMQQSIEQVEKLNTAVQQTLHETKKQTDTIQDGTTKVNEKSDDLLHKLEAEMQRVTATFSQNMQVTNEAMNRLFAQLQVSDSAATQLNVQQQAELQKVAQQLAEKMTENSKQSKKELENINDKFEDLEDELADVKKQLRTPLDVLQGGIQGVKNELQQLKNVTAFLEQKAKESMQLVEATEDAEYVKEAADLVAVLVDRLSVGAQLYAKHRETIEAMEQGEVEQAAWEIEKTKFMGAQQELETLKQALQGRDVQIQKLEKDLEQQKTIEKNRLMREPGRMFQKMAEKTPIEQWPVNIQQLLEDENIGKHTLYTAGTKIAVSGDCLEELNKYVELASSNNGEIELTTSCYIHNEVHGMVIQKAKSVVV